MKRAREERLGVNNFEPALKKLKTENIDIGSLQITSSLSDEQVIEALEFLTTDTNINDLTIGTYITDIPGGMEKLSALLKINKSIGQLCLCDCEIGDEGVIAIIDALRSNQSLTNLDLSSNNIGPSGAKALSALLKDNKFLQTLNISDNDLGLEGLGTITTALGSNFHLKKFYYDTPLDPFNNIPPLLGRNNIIFNEALSIIKRIGESDEITIGSGFIFKFIKNSSQDAFGPEAETYVTKIHHLISKYFFLISGVCKNPIDFGLPAELYTQMLQNLKLEDISWNYEGNSTHSQVEEYLSVTGDDISMLNVGHI
jgi:hypothetical protein